MFLPFPSEFFSVILALCSSVDTDTEPGARW